MVQRRDDLSAVHALDLSIGGPGGIRIVDGVTFDLVGGGTLVVSGPTGSGKSTLAAVLAGVPAEGVSIIGGDAMVGGISARRPGRRRREWLYHTGYLTQSAGTAAPARMTVGESIGEPITSRDRRVNRKALAIRVAALLDEMHLPLGAADKYPYELSAGMLQRVAFARAVVLDPAVFIGDEPLANLDIEVRHVIFDALRRRQAAWGMTSLLVTNDTDLARELEAETITLHAGSVVAMGDYRDIPKPPSTSPLVPGQE